MFVIATTFQELTFIVKYCPFTWVYICCMHPHDRDTWRSGVRSAMSAASQLPGRGPTVVDMAPVPAR